MMSHKIKIFCYFVSGLNFARSDSDKNLDFENGVCDLSTRGSKSDTAGDDPAEKGKA